LAKVHFAIGVECAMLQLVGTACGFCRKRIDSELEGQFCAECGTPHHNRCRTTDAGASRCSRCGGDRSDPTAVRVRTLREQHARQIAPHEEKLPLMEGNRPWIAFIGGLILFGVLVSMLVSPPRTEDRDWEYRAAAMLLGFILILAPMMWPRYQARQPGKPAEETGSPAPGNEGSSQPAKSESAPDQSK
jgi:hypothetical protein